MTPNLIWYGFLFLADEML